MSGIAHFDRELAALDQQIVRLGRLFDLDLTQDATALAVLTGGIAESRYGADLVKPFRLMKALLELRYRVEKHCVEDVGPAACRQILDDTPLK